MKKESTYYFIIDQKYKIMFVFYHRMRYRGYSFIAKTKKTILTLYDEL